MQWVKVHNGRGTREHPSETFSISICLIALCSTPLSSSKTSVSSLYFWEPPHLVLMPFKRFPPSIQSLSDNKHRKQKETQLLTEGCGTGTILTHNLTHFTMSLNPLSSTAFHQRSKVGRPKLAHPDLFMSYGQWPSQFYTETAVEYWTGIDHLYINLNKTERHWCRQEKNMQCTVQWNHMENLRLTILFKSECASSK